MKQANCLLLSALLLLFISSPILAESPKAEARSHFELGMKLLNAKEKDKALGEFQQAIELDENYVEAHAAFQDLMLEKGRRPSLISEYRKRLEKTPEDPAWHYLLGRLLQGQEAEKEFRRSLDLDPNFFWGHFALGQYYHSIDFAKSEAEYRAALRINPESISSSLELVHILSRHLHKIDEGLAELERARTLTKDPDSARQVAEMVEEISSIPTFNLIAFVAYLVALMICLAFSARTTKAVLDKGIQSAPDKATFALILYSTIWFLLLFLSTARGNHFATGPSHVGVPEFLTLIWIAFWPTVVYHQAFLEKSSKVKLHKFYQVMVLYYYLTGIALGLLFSYAIFVVVAIQHRSPDQVIKFAMQAFLCNFVLYGILSMIMTMKANKAQRSLGEDPLLKAHRRWEIFALIFFLFIFWPLAISAVFHVISVGKYFTLISTLTPLPFIIVAFYYEARYAFIDVFIKKTAVIVVTALTTISYYLIVVEKFAQNQIWKNIKYPGLLILLPLIAAIPFLARIIEALVDRYVFKRRFTPSEALSSFSRAIRLSDNEQKLCDLAKMHLSDIFATKNVMIFLADEIKSGSFPIPQVTDEFKRAKGPLALSEVTWPEAKNYLRENEIEVVVPFIIDNQFRGAVALGKRCYREPYLSEDLKLLNSLADQLEFALENIRLERTRRAQELKEQELNILASKAELRALRAQINPHFLFNALNTIASLVRKDANKAEETVEMLSDFFRYTLARSGTDFIPLSEELRFISAYLEIEKARFGNKLRITIAIDPQVQDIKVPCMLLQPVVENAIKHGIASKLEGGKIEIAATRENGFLNLKIEDDGVGFDVAKSRRLYNEGVGLKNVRDRVMTIYGSLGSVEIESEPSDGTTVLIKIPT